MDHAPLQQGSDAPSVERQFQELPNSSNAATRIPHEKAILEEQGVNRVIEFAIELWAFLKERKKFWLLPIVVVLVLFGTLLVLTQGSALAPFIYTLF